ncbi:hypothetical protein ABK040_010114 [Willaertia magna]
MQQAKCSTTSAKSKARILNQDKGRDIKDSSFSAPIVDYSFKQLTSCIDLLGKAIEPRQGEKKLLSKPSTLSKDSNDKNKLLNIQSEEKEEQLIIKRGNRDVQKGNSNNSNFKDDQSDEVSLIDKKNQVSGEEEEEKYSKFLGRGIKLSNNNLTNLAEFATVVNEVLETPEELSWLDLSYNNFSTLETIESLPFNITSLYLHSNNISSLKEIVRLKKFKDLKRLTLFGNPVEEIRNYRYCMLSLFPELKNFDFVTVTDRDRDTAATFKELFWPKAPKKK